MSATENTPESKPNRAPKARRDPVFSCRRLVGYAVVFSVFFLIVHGLGFREYTSILSGTCAFGWWEQRFGVVYILLYGCFVLIVPILLIAAALLKGAAALKRTRFKREGSS